MSADEHHWMWRLLGVQHFVSFGLAWIAALPVSSSSAFTRWALFVALLALVNGEELRDDGAERFEPGEIWLFVIEHLIPALLVRVG